MYRARAGHELGDLILSALPLDFGCSAEAEVAFSPWTRAYLRTELSEGAPVAGAKDVAEL